MADRTPTVASGARSTVAGVASTRLKVDMGDLYKYETFDSALYTTLSMLGKERAIAKTVSWHVNELRPKFMRINNGAGYNSSATTFTVDTPEGNYVQAGFLIKVTRTGETMLTTTGGSATSVVVAARKWGTNVAAALVDNDEILILGPAYAENATLQSAITVTETQYSNYVETKRHNWSMSGLLQELTENGGTYEGSDVALQRVEMIRTHKRDINLVLLHGEKAVSGATASCEGITEFVNRYGSLINSNTLITEPVFESGNRQLFRNLSGGSGGRAVYLASLEFAGIINQFASAVQRTSAGDTKYGLEITDYRSRYGRIQVVTEIGFEGDKYSQYCLGFNPDEVKLKTVRDGRMLKNRQGTSVDGYEEEIITDFSLINGHPEHKLLFNAAVA